MCKLFTKISLNTRDLKILFYTVLLGSLTMAAEKPNELILISAPNKENPYYSDRFFEIIRFQINFANLIVGKNNVIVLADNETIPYLTGGYPDTVKDSLSKNHVLEANVEDIWIRDFGTVLQKTPIFLAGGQGYKPSEKAKRIEKGFLDFLKNNGVKIDEKSLKNYSPENVQKNPTLTYITDLINDGGNVVENMKNTAIITDRALQRNPDYKGDTEVFKSSLRKALNYPNISLITQFADESEDLTGHSDLMVSFLDESTLMYSHMKKDKQARLVQELKSSLRSDIKLVELPGYYFEDSYGGFRSACGLHINSLVTRNYVYMPTFGEDPEAQSKGYTVENDEQAYKILTQNTKKQVVKVPVSYKVCIMGGSVRCLSMQMEGPVADHLIEIAAKK